MPVSPRSHNYIIPVYHTNPSKGPVYRYSGYVPRYDMYFRYIQYIMHL